MYKKDEGVLKIANLSLYKRDQCEAYFL